ncbi:MAG: T9SS type A sorting domain-containing protein, partial [Ignavibacterium sp.]|nr:T9SS type A sorting domain-containing protein [Ignavibacterium sp.]
YGGWNSNFNNIAYWNGTVWNDLNSTLLGGCSALALSGTDLFVGGAFGLQRWFGAYAEGLYSGLQRSATAGAGLVEFNAYTDSTRITLNLINGFIGNGVFNVFCYENKPVGGGILPVSKHRWIIQNKGFLPTISYDDIIRIKFSDFIDSSGIINPYTVQIYHRPTPGRGQFNALYTEYDNNTNELWAYINSYGEFAIGIPSTVDGIIVPGEYVNHLEGQNQQTSDGKTWYMRSDEYYFYFGISNYTDENDAVNIYLDHSGITPVNYHFNLYGTETGTGKDGLYVNLPFGADFFAYVKPTYDEYKYTDQIGGWIDSVANSFIKSYNDPANVFEFAIPLSSLPVSTSIYNYPLNWFNWLGFLSNSGNISSRVPNNANPSGIPDDLSWYYPSSVYSFSFTAASYTHIGLSIPNFGAFNCYNFTFFPISPTASISRTSGEWNIDGELVVYEGTLTFTNPDSVKLVSLLHMDGDINFSGNVPLKVRGNIYQTNTYGANLIFNSGQSTVIDLAFGSGSIVTSAPFQNLTTRFGNIDLYTDIIINESLTLQNGNIRTINFDTSYVRINQGAVVTRSGTGYIDGYLVRWANSGIVDFPVGTANGYSPVSFNLNNVTNPNTITVAAFQEVHPNVVTPAQSMLRYWKITKDNALTFTNTSINFQYLPADFNTAFFEATDEAAMVVGKYDTGTWTFPAILSRSPGLSNDGGSITVSGITSFSDFTLARNEAALPVELSSFTASIVGQKILLNWRTETEVSNYGFEIERAVTNTKVKKHGVEFSKIGFVEGNGNSNSPKNYSFTDDKPFGGRIFQYRLKQIDTDGQFEYSDIVEVEVVTAKFELFQNYPNPFNPSTVISYQLPVSGNVILKIYDVLGNKVATLVDEYKTAGSYEVEFNVAQVSRPEISSGIYFYKLSAGSFSQTKKMILLK